MTVWTLALIASIVLLLFTVRRKFPKRRAKPVAIVLEIGLVLCMTFRVVFPVLPAPAPTGPEAVRVDTVYYKHETAYPDMATEGKEREIPVHVYHPEKMRQGAHPLFLFSHGAFGVGTSNETLFRELASRGYVVMSLDHPHHAFFSKLSTGKTVFADRTFLNEVIRSQGSEDLETALADLNRWIDPRIEDIDFVMDKIFDDKADNAYEGLIDRRQVILSGHSLGGGAVLAVGRARPEDVKALVVLEAPFVKDIEGVEGDGYKFTPTPYPRPILHIYSDALWGKTGAIPTYARNEELIHAKDPKFENRHVKGVGHVGLTDLSRISPILTDQIDGGLDKRKAPQTLLEINRMVIEYLETVEK